ncbi:MAG: MBL fold metallo-hydrolase [bacterium]|nr:MBL fold metallo-hydrolase [bacterium]
MLKLLKKYKVLIAILLGLSVADVTLWILLTADQRGASGAELYFLNIGQGDSQLIVLPGDIKVLIDGGPTGAVLDNLARILSPVDRRIDIVMMTHPQLDHFAGLIDVLNTYDVGAFVSSGRKADVEAYRELHQALVTNNVPYIQLTEGDALRIGEARFDILSPSSQESVSGELNDSSVVALLTTPDFRALYTGDIGENIESRLVRDYDIDVDVLKVGHHGSRFSSSEEFLKEASPAISVIEVGKNTYGHPTAAALDRLLKYGSQIFRTDQQGLIKIVFRNGQFQVLGAR